MDFLLWFTRPENAKPLALVIFLTTFIGIVLYVYGNRRRGERLESYGEMPFLDDEQGHAIPDPEPADIKKTETHTPRKDAKEQQ
jgi:cbb3-type cytochrome oxidase subunit 3